MPYWIFDIYDLSLQFKVPIRLMKIIYDVDHFTKYIQIVVDKENYIQTFIDKGIVLE